MQPLSLPPLAVTLTLVLALKSVPIERNRWFEAATEEEVVAWMTEMSALARGSWWSEV